MRTFACAHAHKQTLEEEAVRFAEDASVTPDCGVAAVMLISGVWRREPEMKAHSRMRHALGGDRGWWEAGDGRGGEVQATQDRLHSLLRLEPDERFVCGVRERRLGCT